MSKKTVWFIALLLTTLPSFAQFRAGVKGGGKYLQYEHDHG